MLLFFLYVSPLLVSTSLTECGCLCALSGLVLYPVNLANERGLINEVKEGGGEKSFLSGYSCNRSEGWRAGEIIYQKGNVSRLASLISSFLAAIRLPFVTQHVPRRRALSSTSIGF